jgi:hypothetical protein
VLNSQPTSLNNNNNNNLIQFIDLRASLTAHRPITKQAREEKTYTDKKQKQKNVNNNTTNSNNNSINTNKSEKLIIYIYK